MFRASTKALNPTNNDGHQLEPDRVELRFMSRPKARAKDAGLHELPQSCDGLIQSGPVPNLLFRVKGFVLVHSPRSGSRVTSRGQSLSELPWTTTSRSSCNPTCRETINLNNTRCER